WCVLHGFGSPVHGMGQVTVNAASTSDSNAAQFSTTLSQAIADTTSTTVHVAGEPGGGAIDVARVGDVFRIGSENVKITAKTSAAEWEVIRNYGSGVDPATTTAASHPVGATVIARCSAWPERGATGIWWNFATDPHGYNANGLTVDTDNPYMGTGHQMFGLNDTFVRIGEDSGCSTNAGSPMCWVTRIGAMPESLHRPPTHYVNVYPPFAGLKAFSYGPESHPSQVQTQASAYEQQWMLDSRPIIAGTFLAGPSAKVAGATQLYLSSETLNPKRLATYAFCGAHPLKDISGPGSAIGDGAADAYKYCVAAAAGECYPGSAAGQVYVNCPNLTNPGGCYSNQYQDSLQSTEDICVGDGMAGFGAQVVQIGVQQMDRASSYSRVITAGFGRYRRQPEAYWANGKALPDGSWALFTSRWVDNQRSDIYAVKLPPYPARDSVNRATFVPMPVQVGTAPAGATTAVVEFGYDTDFHCTSRGEACVAASGAVNEANPFRWASETYSGVPCAGGCTIAIPAIPQRVLYYRVNYRASDATVTARGRTEVAVAP
ncbi:MAG: hypothetical protein M1436_07185, partial [Acidobacteria bacterium]|nr:hypothetical protein [Acidobacteriota bacterium]